jgi:DNA-binding NtrC family response regulator
MLSYNWRGNVRELQNVIERAVLLSKNGVIDNLNIPANNMNASIAVNIERANEGIPVAAVAASAVSVSSPMAHQHPETFMPPMVSAFESINSLDGEGLFEEIGRIIVNKLPEPADDAQQDDVFNSLEYGVVLAALKRTGGNKQAAANLLGLYRPRLYGMIKRHNLDEKIA